MPALKIFHHAELEEATNNFDNFLGKGGYGSVYYGETLISLHILNQCSLLRNVLISMFFYGMPLYQGNLKMGERLQ